MLDAGRPAAATVAVGEAGEPVAAASDWNDVAAPGGLLDRLRSPVGSRPSVDPSLAGGLRAWLEDGVAAAGHDTVLVVQPGDESALAIANGGGSAARPSLRDLRTALLRTVFRITVTAGPPRAAFEDALAALAVANEGDLVVDAVRRLSRHRRTQLRELVRHAASVMATQWGPPPAGWLPRTGERLVAPLAGGRVVLRSDADLVMGGPSSGRASVCAVRVHGASVRDDGPNRRLLALLETLRSGAAPFRVASYDLDRDALTVEDVTDGHLSAAVHEVLALVDGRARAHERGGQGHGCGRPGPGHKGG